MPKSGVYKIGSKLMPSRIYIGSSKDLQGRFNSHLHELTMNKHCSIKMQIHVNKYGIEDLEFEILEICDCVREILIEREQFYLDLFKPYFNTCKKTYSTLGVPCSDSAKEKLRMVNLGKKMEQATKDKIRFKSKKMWENASEEEREKMFGMKGKSHSKETIDKMVESGKKRVDEEFIERMRAFGHARKGKREHITFEYREKMRQAAYKRWNKNKVSHA